VVETLERCCRKNLVELSYVSKPYTHGVLVGEGAYVKYAAKLDDFQRTEFTRKEAFVDLNGSELDRWEWDSLAAFWSQFRSINARCTQIHIAGDDGSESFDFRALEELAEVAGGAKPFRKQGQLRKDSRGTAVTWGLAGKLGGGVQVQFYDKTKESGGLIKAHRCEARFWKVDDRAQQVWDCVFPEDLSGQTCASREQFATFGRDVLAGAIVLPEGERFDWWRGLIAGSQAFRTGAPRKYQDDGEKLYQWLKTAAFTPLAALLQRAENQGRRAEFLERFFNDVAAAKDNFKAHHKAIAGDPQWDDAPDWVGEVTQDDLPFGV